MTKIQREKQTILITFDNQTTVEVRLSSDGDVQGIGTVTAAGVPLRKGDVPLYPWLRSTDGVDYARFPLRAVEELPGGGVALHTAALGTPRLESPYGDQYNGNLFSVSQRSAPVEDRLTWILEPAEVTLEGVRYAGFSYRWDFASETQKLHRIVAHTTWEIGGRATGNTILSQGQVTPAVYRAEPDNHFTSACLQSLVRFGDPTAMSFQLCPRWGVHQCFDFFTHERGTLLGCWEGKHDTRSFVQRNPGEEVIFVVDAEHWKASAACGTAAKAILFAPAGPEGMPEHVGRNRWKAAYDHCTETIRSLFHIRRSLPAPERMLPYGQRLRPDNTLEMRVGDVWVPSQEWLAALADLCLPTLAKQGIKRVITEPIVETDPTERGLLSKLGALGLHGDLNVGSVCCVHRYRPAALFGGMKAWRHYCDRAHALGLEVGHWIGPHLAHHAPILQEHPEWAVRGFNTMIAAGGYPNFVLAVLNWNTPVRQWVFDDLKRMREEGGLDYVWFDSLANLGMYPIDFAREMETNTFALLEFIADLQQAGVATVAIEGMSPAGVSGAYIMDEGPAHDGGVQWIAGQNAWRWYEGNEDMLCGQQMRTWTHRTRSEDDMRRRLFRCLANGFAAEVGRIMPVCGEPDPKTRATLARYEAVKGDLARRELLPERRGVLWHNGRRNVLFAFQDFTHALPPGARVEVVGEAGPAPLACRGALEAKAWEVYRWEAK